MTIRSMPRGLGLLALLLLAFPMAAGAAESGAPYKIRVNLAFFAGFQRYSMTEFNAGIDDVNAALQTDPDLAELGFKLDPLRGGSGLGAGIRVWPRERFMIAGDYTHLSGASSISVPVSTQAGAPALKAKAGVPAQSIGLTVGYFLYKPWASLDLGVGVGGAYYICDGELEFSFPTYHEKTDLHGTGFGVHGMVLGDLRLSDTVHFEAALGYRHAKTTDLRYRGVAILNADGSKLLADYSGLIARFGIDIPFGPVK
jgi:hypothetical protein